MARLLVAIAAYAAADDAPVFAGPVAALCAANEYYSSLSLSCRTCAPTTPDAAVVVAPVLPPAADPADVDPGMT